MPGIVHMPRLERNQTDSLPESRYDSHDGYMRDWMDRQGLIPPERRIIEALDGWEEPGQTVESLLEKSVKLTEAIASISWAELQQLHRPDLAAVTFSAKLVFGGKPLNDVMAAETLPVVAQITQRARGARGIPVLERDLSELMRDFNGPEPIEVLESEVLTSWLFEWFERNQLEEFLENWLEMAVARNTPEAKANAVFILRQAENPWLFVMPEVTEWVEGFGEFEAEVKAKLEYFFQELFFTWRMPGLHDWGYVREAAREMVRALADKDLGKRLIDDLGGLAKNYPFLVPAHVFLWRLALRQKFKVEESMDSLLRRMYGGA